MLTTQEAEKEKIKTLATKVETCLTTPLKKTRKRTPKEGTQKLIAIKNKRV